VVGSGLERSGYGPGSKALPQDEKCHLAFFYLVLNADRGRNDRLGALYRAHMQQSGVVFNEKPVQGMTGTCVVLISDDAQRTMLTCLGVSSEIDYEDIDEELLKHSSYIYLEGYLFESERTVQTML